MKKVSYYLVAIVLAGVSILSYWVYQKYFKVEQQNLLVFQALRGEVRETVTARGEVVAQKEFDLEFPFGGTVEKIYVSEGQTVAQDAPLTKLDTRELELEKNRIAAIATQREAALAKLLAGVTPADLKVSEAKVASANQALGDARATLVDALRAAFTQADDAVYSKADQLFNNPRSAHPTFNFTLANSQLKTTLETDRSRLESMLVSWKARLSGETTDLGATTADAKSDLTIIRTFLANIAEAINAVTPTVSTTQAMLDTWRADIAGSRTSIDAAMTTIIAAEGKVRSAESAYALATRELALKESAPRAEDIAAAKAQVEENKAELATVQEKIRKSTLRAPGVGVVKKINLEIGEVFKPGTSALLFTSSGYKIQADISELDIGKVRDKDGNEASIRFDAFSDRVFKGQVVFVEPKEIIKDEDVYFRTDIFLGERAEGVRSGMSADVILYGVTKKDVLRVPELAVYKREGRSFVKVARGALRKEEVSSSGLVEIEVTTGISDGELVEVTQGLHDNEFVVVSTD